MTQLNYSLAWQAEETLRTSLLPFLFFFALLGHFEAVSRSRNHGQSIVMYWISCAAIIILSLQFTNILLSLHGAIETTMDTNAARNENLFAQILNAKLPETPSIFDFSNHVLYALIRFVQTVGRVGLVFVHLLQDVSVIALCAVSPLMLGFFLTSWTKGIAIRYVLAAFAVATWSVGVSIIDLVLVAVGEHVFTAALATAGINGVAITTAGGAAGLSIATMAIPALLVIVTMAALIPVALYISVPIGMSALLLGANPITATLSASAGIAGAGMGIAGAAAGRSIGMAGALASRAASAGAGSGSGSSGSSSQHGIAPHSETLAPPPSANPGGGGPSSAASGGVVQAASGAFAPAPGAPHTSAPVGHTISAPGSSGMTAMQISAAQHSVTNASGQTRTFSGNIGSPTTLAASFNRMMSEPPKPS